MSRVLLDAGALIALDRGNRAMLERLAAAHRDGTPLVTHGGVLGQVWRGPKQALLARALHALDVRHLDAALGKRAGQLLAAARMNDVVDAALVALAAAGDRIYTSDPDDLLVLANAAGLRDVDVVPV